MPFLDPLMPAPMDAFDGAPPAPDQPFVAIGDVHGRADLLAPILARAAAQDLPVVLVGDYIDHGPDSAAVLRLLQDRAAQMALTCLRGNHEDLLLRFLRRPRKTGRLWLRYGGRATLDSYGIDDLPEQITLADLVTARDRLRAAMGATVTWMQSMPFWWQSGNVAVLHAGADPALPLADQLPKAMAWGHPDFGLVARRDGVWCVHGHRIMRRLTIREGVVSIDTGAWKTGKLCAVLIGAGHIKPF
ncbi:serine/threonine-protein phosphatase 2 [Yoonia vestfoldensis]|jgi:serine/threonine protein phosphatase 1|uniref:Serine/threonine-protein phosphatase 2 n=2 Tax=Yoonia vestfoldensis TaxID=245188 RepID=A0A1Y0EDJ1_9RHOB|nr:serine/threonine-protein phosphatase 2 [Yoonia vestfoldensis]